MKKVLSVLLALCLLVVALPLSAAADGEPFVLCRNLEDADSVVQNIDYAEAAESRTAYIKANGDYTITSADYLADPGCDGWVTVTVMDDPHAAKIEIQNAAEGNFSVMIRVNYTANGVAASEPAMLVFQANYNDGNGGGPGPGPGSGGPYALYLDAAGQRPLDGDFYYTAEARTVYILYSDPNDPNGGPSITSVALATGPSSYSSDVTGTVAAGGKSATLTINPNVIGNIDGGLQVNFLGGPNSDEASTQHFNFSARPDSVRLLIFDCDYRTGEVDWAHAQPRTAFPMSEAGSFALFYGTVSEPGDPLLNTEWKASSGDLDALQIGVEAEVPAVWRISALHKTDPDHPVTLTLKSGKDDREYRAQITVEDPFIALCAGDHYDPDQAVFMNSWWYTASSKAYVVSSDPNVRFGNVQVMEGGAYVTASVVNGGAAIEIAPADGGVDAGKAELDKDPYWYGNIGLSFELDGQGFGFGFKARPVEPGFYCVPEGFDGLTGEMNIHPTFLLGNELASVHFVAIAADGTATAMTPDNSALSVEVDGQTATAASGGSGPVKAELPELAVSFSPENWTQTRFQQSSWTISPAPSLNEGFTATLTFTENGGAVHSIVLSFGMPEFYFTTDPDAVFPASKLTNGSFHYGAAEEQKKVWLVPTGDLDLPGTLQLALHNGVMRPDGWVEYRMTTNSAGRRVAEFTILRSRDVIGWVNVQGTYADSTLSGLNITNGVLGEGFGAEHEHKPEYNCWVWASNTAEHWQVCKGCGVEKENSRAAHTIGADGACSVCGYKEVTVSTVNNGVVGEKGSGAGSVTVTSSALDSQTSAVTINAGGNSVEYDSTALAAIKSEASGQDVKLVVEERDPDASATDQTQAIADAVQELERQMADTETNPNVSQSLADQMKVVHLSLTSGSTEIENFNGGTATVTVPYTVFSDVPEEDIRVYRVEMGGTLTQVPSTVNADNTVTWETESHSYYMITPKVQDDPVTPRPVYSGGGDEDEEEPNRPFTDVANPKAWYYDAVYYGFDKGYFAGVSTTEFAPTTTMNRAMFATVLYHMAGKPEVTATKSFSDVAAGKWYTNGVLWGASKGIISGYPNGNFGPTDPVTREQMAVLFWNYAGKPTVTADLSKFSDADKISTYAKAAMNWAVSVGIINGKGNGILDPKSSATRAEVAQIVMNYDTKVEK